MSLVLTKPGSLDAPSTGGDTRTNDLPTGFFAAHNVKVAGNSTKTGGSSDPTLAEDAPFSLVTLAEIKSRKGTYMRASGKMLYHLARYDNAKAGPGDVAPTSSGPSVVSTGAHAFSFFLPLRFAPKAIDVRSALGALFVDGDKPQISITYGTAQPDLNSGGDGVETIDSLTATMFSERFDSLAQAPDKIRVIDEITVPITQAQTDLKVKLNARVGRRTRLLLFRFRYSGSRSNTPCNRIKIWKQAGALLYEGLWAEIQEMTREVLGAAPPAGIGVVDFDYLKLGADLPLTETFQDYYAEVDVAAPSGTTDVTCLADSVVDAGAFSKQ